MDMVGAQISLVVELAKGTKWTVSEEKGFILHDVENEV